MMDIKISPRKLGGAFCALPSKSEAHRALILAALGLTNMWVGVFADVGVAVLAILNAMRPLKFKT